MHEKKLLAEMVININPKKDLDEMYNMKLDLLLLEIPIKERYKEIKPVTEPLIKPVIKSITVTKPDAKEAVKPESKEAAAKAEAKPETNPSVPARPTAAIKVSSIIAKASVRHK